MKSKRVRVLVTINLLLILIIISFIRMNYLEQNLPASSFDTPTPDVTSTAVVEPAGLTSVPASTLTPASPSEPTAVVGLTSGPYATLSPASEPTAAVTLPASTAQPTPASKPTATPAPTSAPKPTATYTPAPTSAPKPTTVSKPSATPVLTTSVPEPTATSKPTATHKPTATPKPTSTPTPPTSAPKPTATATPPTSAPKPTATYTPTPTPTSTPTPTPSPATTVVENNGLSVTTLTNNATAQVKVTSSWESGERFFYQLDIVIENRTSTLLTDWQLKLSVQTSASIETGWNAAYTLEDSGRQIIIAPLDYNKQIAGNSTTSCGLILSTGIKLAESSNPTNTPAPTSPAKPTPEKPAPDKPTPATPTPEQPTPATSADESSSSKNQLYSELGKLSVQGTTLVDSQGNPVQLHGISSIGIAWYPEYICKETFEELRDNWNLNLIRLTMYTEEYGGYCNGGDKKELKKIIKNGVKYATELGMYVIIDWHILSDGNPNTNLKDAKAFFKEMSKDLKDYDNVFYEICNEPNGNVSWSDIKSYAETIIPIIRKNDADAVIMVGTPTWSQDVDAASRDPITAYDNLLYSLHFYAATHGQSLRDKMTVALNNGLPLFVNEFSICDASGSGRIDYNEGNAWIEALNEHNIGYCLWNLSRKNETSAVIKPDCSKLSGWTENELSDIANWYRALH